MKKIYLILLLGMFLITFSSSATYKQGDILDFKKPCTNDGMICNATTSCNVSIKYPNSTYFVNNGVMTNQNNGDFNYTLTAQQTNVGGIYVWDMYCCHVANCGEGHGTFEVAYSNYTLDTPQSILNVAILFILVIMFIISVYTMIVLPSSNEVDDEGMLLSINKLKYIRPILFIVAYVILLALMYSISNLAFAYLKTTMLGTLFFTIYRIMFLMLFPMIVFWLVYIFVKIWQDNEFQHMIERGIPIETP